MDVDEYLKQTKDIYQYLLDYVDNQYSDSIDLLGFTQILEDKSEFINLLHLISKISKNHHRLPNFNDKINQILLNLQNYIKQALSNFEIMKIFKSNKQILLFLIKNQIITIDESISLYFLSKQKTNYLYYFFPEIKSFIPIDEKERIEKEMIEIDQNIFDNFEEKRQINENETIICSFIRNDSIDDFISHVNRSSIPLSATINPSIFETNHYLMNKEVSLIEYATFFGSIKIFQYLKVNNIELKPSLWLYAIHGNNSEIIQFLEENHIVPEDELYVKCFVESIKCHHNEFAVYIFDNFLNGQNKNEYIPLFFQYYNYSFIIEAMNEEPSFFYLCQYNYNKLVKNFLKTKENEIKEFINISTKYF